MKIGSLFDGSGGFLLAGRNCGLEPAWLSEINPNALKVSRKNFPNVPNWGDIRNIKGNEINPVEIITMGSPCQDLSVLGKKTGINGEKSSLFFEGIRIVKEMRKATKNLFPRFVIWENVPGALTNNDGEDFCSVLNSFVDILEDNYVVPKSFTWQESGFINLDRASLGWRVFNTKYFGLPQNRKRVYLVLDTRGKAVTKILFKQNWGEFNRYLQTFKNEM